MLFTPGIQHVVRKFTPSVLTNQISCYKQHGKKCAMFRFNPLVETSLEKVHDVSKITSQKNVLRRYFFSYIKNFPYLAFQILFNPMVHVLVAGI